MERPSIMILVGISGCGKSTWCKYIANNAVILSMDAIRKSFGNVSDQSRNKEVASIFDTLLDDEIKMCHNIIIDNTNLNIKHIDNIVNRVKDYDIRIVLFDESFDWKTCQERVKNDRTNRARTDTVMVDGKPLHQVMSEKYDIVRKQILQKYRRFVTSII